jgi:flavin reductase (DIM6/NTAB) family NADH-FMN oxidoreductase RutF
MGRAVRWRIGTIIADAPRQMLTAAIDARTLRKTVGHFVTGVTVVAFDDVDGTTRAMTANSFTSLSLDPPLILFCVGKETRTGRAIHDATGFSINILAEDQQTLSQYFAGAWRHDAPPPFTFVAWEGQPRLEGCAASLACDVHAIHEGGDHWIVIGRVVRVHCSNGETRPLVFFRGEYGVLGRRVASPA